MIADGAGVVIPAGANYAIFTQAVIPASGFVPNVNATGYAPSGGSDGYLEGAFTPATGGTFASGDNAGRFMASQVLGELPNPTPYIVWLGDSISWGQGGSTAAGSYVTIGVNNTGKCSVLLQAQPGEVAASVSGFATGAMGYLQFLKYATHVGIMLGTNDLGSNSSLQNIKYYLSLLGSVVASFGVPAYACTILPRATSSDNWATLANQTVPANDAVRVAGEHLDQNVAASIFWIYRDCRSS